MMKRSLNTRHKLTKNSHRLLSIMVVTLLLVQALPLPQRLASSAGPASRQVTQTTVTLDPVSDATLDSAQPDTALGVASTLEVFYAGQNEIGRALLRFNLAAAVPSNAVIESATLKLYLETGSADGPIDLTATNILADWTESTVTWNTQPVSGTTSTVNSVDISTGLKELDVTEVIQAWHNVPHYGLVLTGAEGFAPHFYTFTSREGDANQPVLEVIYHLSSDYTVSGQVQWGSPSAPQGPLAGATIELYGDGDNSPTDGPGVLLTSTLSSETGVFELQWSGEPYPYYHLVQFGPPDTYPSGVLTDSLGTINNPSTVTLADPGSGSYGGFTFYDANWPEGCDELLVNGDFEEGTLEPWGSSGTVSLGPGREGSSGVQFGGVITTAGEIWQGVTIPAEVESTVMSFWWKAEADTEKPGDALKAIIQYAGGDDHLLWLPATGTLGVWRYAALDLGAYAGEQVAITFHAHTFDNNPTTFTVDDVQLTSCGGHLPDLVVTDLWPEDNRVCYQLRNQGDYPAEPGHITALDRVEVARLVTETVNMSLEPGGRWSSCFDYDWTCTGSTDPLMVSADVTGIVPEWENQNNWREEGWRCDDTPPTTVSGPTVTNRTANSAVVQWETDEPGDSQVLFGSHSREYDRESYTSTLVISHSVTLWGLTPNTVYRFMVTSADAENNRSAGDTGSFQTLPEDDGQDPGLSLRDPGLWRDTVTVVADTSDNQEVDKVAFCLQSSTARESTNVPTQARATTDDFCLIGELLWTDYSAPFEVAVDTTQYDNGDYTLLARVYDASGRSATDQVPAQFANLIDPDDPIVIITSPSEGQTVSGKIQVTAQLSDDTGLAYVYFWVNGDFQEFHPLPSHPKSTTLTFELDTTTITKTNTVLAVDALDTNFNQGRAIRHVTVGQPSPPALPKLTLTQHTVTRKGNAIEVALTVKNVGQSVAKQVEVVDSLRGFQPISRTVAYPHAINYEASFLVTPKLWHESISDTADLAAGASRTYTYTAIPVMVYPSPPSPAVGEAVYLYYEDTAGHEYSDQIDYPVSITTGDQSIGDAWVYALKEASYLLVTNPQRLNWYHVNQRPVDQLLSAMAELAYYKNGALGFIYLHDRAALDSLIEPPTLYSWLAYGDNWSYRLHPDFHKLYTGALLIVGETEIVPAWEQGNFSINWGKVQYSDQPYADIGGSPAPELMMGRIVGDSATTMIKPIQASIGVYTGDPNYAFDQLKAMTVSGPGLGTFVKDVDDIGLIMHDKGYLVAEAHTKDYFWIDSFALAYHTGDDLAVGEVLAANAGEEIVFLDDSLEMITIYDKAGSVLGSFSAGFGSNSPYDGDEIAVANNHIIKADAGGNRVLVYDSSGTVQSYFNVTFDPTDEMATGDMVGTNLEEIVIADNSADQISYYSEAGTLAAQNVSHTFDSRDLLAVGDVMSDAKDEVVIGDRSTGQLLIFSAAGTQLGSLQLKDKKVNGTTLTALEYFDRNLTSNWDEGGSALAIGDLFPYPSGADSGKEEILLAPARNSDHMFPTWWYASENKLRDAAPVPWNFDGYEGLAIGEMGTYELRNQDEILIADDAGYIRLLDTNNWLTRWHRDVPMYTANSDTILLSGHGNVDGCCGLSSYSNLFPLDFNGHNPVALGLSCLTGNYQDKNDKLNFPDRMLDSGAAVYIGSTQDSSGYQNREAGKWLYKNWDYGEPIGKVFTELERSYWKGSQTDDWYFWSYEYNLYGDPLFGANATNRQATGLRLPDATLDIEVPAYTVTRTNDLDWVEIPGGRLWSEPGKLWLPYYSVLVEVPAGQRVRSVEMIGRSTPITDTGLLLSMVPITPTICACTPEPYSGYVDGWYPPLEYDWEIIDNLDGSSTLVVSTFPFQYNPLTTDVQFFQSYSFEVLTDTVDAIITGLSTDRPAYNPGEMVNMEVAVKNDGDPQDVVVSVLIKHAGTEETVTGMPLTVLDELYGPAAVSLEWDSSGVEPGAYLVEVTLQAVGSEQILDLETQRFDLGIAGGAITQFAAGPQLFHIGDDIELSLTFENTGTVTIDGTAVFEVWNENGELVTEFAHEISDLSSGAATMVQDVWQTAAVVEATYTVKGYVSYGSTATEPLTARVSTNAFIYLPLVIRSGN